MKRFAYIQVASCYLLMAYGGAFDPSAGIGIFDGSNDVGPTLYPPQPNLGAWYYSADATNAFARVGSNATYTGNNCLSFDGVGDRAEFGNIGNIVNSVATDFSLEFTANLDAAVNFDCFFGKFSSSVNGWRIDQPSTGNISFFFYDGTNSGVTTCAKASGWATYRVERVSDQYTWYLNDVAQTPVGADTLSGQGYTHNTSSGTAYRLGSRNNSPYAAMTISYMKLVEDGSTTCEAHFCEGARYVIYDVSGNGNHGTITTTSGLTTMRTTGDGPAWNIADGFSSIATFDGTAGDYLTVPGLTTADEVTLNGSTAIPTVSAGKINFTAGTVIGILINDELVYMLNAGSGTTVPSLSESWSDATITASDIDAFWQLKIPALADGSADALGNPITNPGGFVHNGAESSIVFPAGLLGAGAVTNTGAELLAWGPTTNFPIRNVFVYTNTISNTNLLELYCEIFDGIYTNATP